MITKRSRIILATILAVLIGIVAFSISKSRLVDNKQIKNTPISVSPSSLVSESPLETPTKGSLLEPMELLSIAFDNDGFLWTAEGGVVYKWDLANETFEALQFKNASSTRVLDIVVDDNHTVWIATEDGIWQYDQITWKRYLIGKTIYLLALSPDGTMWAYGWERSVYHFNGQIWDHYSVEFPVYSMAVAPDNKLWVSLFGRGEGSTKFLGLRSFDGNNWQDFSGISNIGSSDVPFVTKSPDGQLWFCSNKGIFRYNGKEILQQYSENLGQGQENTIIKKMIVQNDEFWILTENFEENHLFSFDGTKLRDYPLPVDQLTYHGFLEGPILSFSVSPHGNVCFSAVTGVFCLNKQTGAWKQYLTR